MSVHQDLDVLSKKADIFRAPPHAEFAANAYNITRLSADAEVNPNAFLVMSGNGRNFAEGSMYDWARPQGGDGLNAEEKEERKKREREQSQALLRTVIDQSIITQEIYNDLIKYYDSKIQAGNEEIAAIDKGFAEREKERQDLKAKDEELKKKLEETQEEASKAKEAEVSADNKVKFHEGNIDKLEELAENGGGIDNQGNEYQVRVTEDGKQEFYYVDEAGREHTAPPSAVIHGQALLDLLKKEEERMDVAESDLEKAALESDRVEGIYNDMLGEYSKYIDEMRLKLEFLDTQDGVAQERKDRLKEYVDKLEEQKKILESEEFQEKLNNGELTEQDLRDIMGDAEWNIFAKMHANHQITPVQLDENEQKLYAKYENFLIAQTTEDKNIAYLESQDTLSALKSGALTMADAVAQVGEATWNWFVAKNPEQNLAMTQMNEIEEQKLEQRLAFQRYKDTRITQPTPEETTTVAVAESEQSTTPATLAANISTPDPSDITPTNTTDATPTSTTATTLASADGQGIESSKDLSGAFKASVNPATPAVTPTPNIAPVVMAQAPKIGVSTLSF